MDVESVRDWALIIAGMLWGVVTIGVVAVLLVLLYGSVRGLRMTRTALSEQGRPALDQVHSQLLAIRDRTSALPRAIPMIEGQARPTLALTGPRPPARRRRRRFFFLRR
jgi:hypothetical protein